MSGRFAVHDGPPSLARLRFFIGAALLGLILTGIVAYQDAGFVKAATHTTGTVVSENYGCGHVTLHFTTLAGEAIDVPGHGATCLHTGETVNLLYLPEDPRGSVAVDRFGALFFLPLGLGFVTLLLSGMAWWESPSLKNRRA